ncbi:MAG: hypothetical protein VB050_05600 [Geobacteraceae bacterium]|nr:hypothetical protein [Geobacteraceae bacterium]
MIKLAAYLLELPDQAKVARLTARFPSLLDKRAIGKVSSTKNLAFCISDDIIRKRLNSCIRPFSCSGHCLSFYLKEDDMKKAVTAGVSLLAAVALAGMVYAAEDKFPEQDATVTTTVYDAEGKVVKEDKVTDTTKGADTTKEFKELQKQQAKEEMKTGEKKEGAKKACPAKKKAAKKKVKKAKSKAKAEPAAAPEAPVAPEEAK